MKHRCGQRNHHRDILAMCCEVISSFVIFVVLDLRVADVVLKRGCKLFSFYRAAWNAKAV